MRIDAMQDLNVIIPKIKASLKDKNKTEILSYLQQIKEDNMIINYSVNDNHVDLKMLHEVGIHRLPIDLAA